MEKKQDRDWGIEAGKWLLARIETRSFPAFADASVQTAPPAFGDDEEPPAYRTADGTPRQSINHSRPASLCADDLKAKLTNSKSKTRGVRRAFTKQVILNIVGFGILA